MANLRPGWMALVGRVTRRQQPIVARSQRAAEAVLLVTPPLLLGSTRLAYRRLAARFGLRGGYFGGFLCYWLGWCAALPVALLGPRHLRALVRAPGRRPTRAEWLAPPRPPPLPHA